MIVFYCGSGGLFSVKKRCTHFHKLFKFIIGLYPYIDEFLLEKLEFRCNIAHLAVRLNN